MIDVMDWRDPRCDWWAKAQHAGSHIELVRAAELEYLNRAPWSLDPEPTGQNYVTNLRLRVLEPPPTWGVLHAGDALHNMSSALDSIAFALARKTFGPELDSDERLQRQTEFPVKYSKQDLLAWANERGRSRLFSPEDLDTLWHVQSYFWARVAWEESESGPTPGSPEEREARARDPLTRLRDLNNVDKHRRLHISLLGPDVPNWGSSGGSLRQVRMGGAWRDGEVVAQVFDPPSDAVDTDINWDLRLVLVEAGRRPILVDELSWLLEVVRQTLSQVIRRSSSP